MYKKSISNDVQYVILHSKNWMKKHQNMPFWLSIIVQFAVAGKSPSSAVHLKKKECNKCDLTHAQCI
jgi:hypothetical protein